MDSGVSSSGSGASGVSGNPFKDMVKNIKSTYNKTQKALDDPTSVLPPEPKTPSLPKTPSVKGAVGKIPSIGKSISKGMK